MADILGIGVATVDVVTTVERYPRENTKIRAEQHDVRRGGNATNTLVVLSQLGHRCSWGGVLVDTPASATIRAELDRFNIDLAPCRRTSSGTPPTSYIVYSRSTGSRTIVHYRDAAEFSADDFARIDLSAYDWIHFEGRNIAETHRMLQRVKSARPHLRCSVEVEQARAHIDTLFEYAEVLLFSQHYAHECGFDQPVSFLEFIAGRVPGSELVCAWGAAGAAARDRAGTHHRSPAFPPARLLDTVGAGDTFNAGYIDARIRKLAVGEALVAACRLAGRKCGQIGLYPLAESAARENSVNDRDSDAR